MEISIKGLNLLEDLEGLRLKAYPDPATGGNPWTIGIGSTIVNGKPVLPGMTCTKEEAYEYCKEHLKSDVYPTIKRYVKVKLNQNQFDALCSFIYNIGVNAFINSTLLVILNNGQYKNASKQILRWTRANKRVMPGLVTRRRKEQMLFDSIEDV